MKYVKILIKPTIWHLKPYILNEFVCDNHLTHYGFLCFDLIITWKNQKYINPNF